MVLRPEGSPSAPSQEARKSVVPVFLAALGGGLSLLGGILLGPLAKSLGWARTADILYAVYSPLCHQMPDRCFSLRGFPMTVCSRCLGIYAGFVAGTALYPFLRGFGRLGLPRAKIFLLFTLPLAVDGLAGLIGLWTTPAALRFSTGLLWGGLLPFYFIPGVASAFLERKTHVRSPET